MKADGPARGAVLQLEPVDLAANEQLPEGGTASERDRWKRDNVARRCWRLVHIDGTYAGIGLFVSIAAAEELARERGWTVVPPEEKHR